MTRRIENYTKVFPQGYQAMAALNRTIEESDLAKREPKLIELVKMRASQINGCAFCLDMHSKDARAIGEREDRLYVLPAWRETDFYSERERAALAWTEALTLLPSAGELDEEYANLESVFTEEEIMSLTWAIVVINGWNRIARPLKSPPGLYVSRRGQASPK
ncbi:MAG: carboxymuconolactone decarboxylase family protein [Hyphomicrobiales bacterium]